MFSKYIKAAMQRAKYEILEEDGTYVGTIPGCQGVWANAETVEACAVELREVLEDWILIRMGDGLSLPEIGGLVPQEGLKDER